MRKLFYIVSIILILSSCSSGIISKSKNPAEAATCYFNYLTNGKYDSYLKAMISCDSIPLSYKKRLKAILKQYNKELKKGGGLVSFEIEQTKYNNDKTKADVFILLHFKNKEKESIVYQLIKKEDRWRLK